MSYITFSNKWGQTIKLWVVKEGNKYYCYRLDNINAKADGGEGFTPPTEYKMFNGKGYDSAIEAEQAMNKYVDMGVKAKIYTNKVINN